MTALPKIVALSCCTSSRLLPFDDPRPELRDSIEEVPPDSGEKDTCTCFAAQCCSNGKLEAREKESGDEPLPPGMKKLLTGALMLANVKRV